MILIVAFAVFIAAMVTCIVTGHSIVLGLAAGFVTFIVAGYFKGFKVKDTFDSMQQLSKVMTSLKQLEAEYKEEQDEVSGLRGDTMPGAHD